MKKSILSAVMIGAMLILSGCGSKEVVDHKMVTVESGQVAPKISIGSALDSLALKDQFDKPHTIEATTKKVIFVFTKATGHLVKEFLKTQSEDFMAKRDIQFVADVSRMPSLIRDYVALPDLKKSNYPILLILNEAVAESYKNSANSEAIMLVNLNQHKVTKVNFVSNITDFQKEIE